MQDNFKIKSIVFLFVLNVLVGCVNVGKKSTIKETISDFSVEDTEAITKVFIADNSNRTVLLERKDDYWLLDGKYRARPDLINVMLSTLSRVTVKQYVPKSKMETVIRRMATNARKVEIYKNDKLVKTFFVGGPTASNLGTYMLMKGSDRPFICYVPGFRGYLSNHFSPNSYEWREKVIFKVGIDDIASVKIEFLNKKDESFKVVHKGNGNLELYQLYTGKQIKNFNVKALRQMMRHFHLMGFENFVDVNATRLDSVKRNYKLYKVTLKKTNGQTTTVQLYQVPLPGGGYSLAGEPIKIDLDRMYGLVNNEILTYCQYFTFDPVTKPLSFYLKKETNN